LAPLKKKLAEGKGVELLAERALVLRVRTECLLQEWRAQKSGEVLVGRG
jgi:hypothetical protein